MVFAFSLCTWSVLIGPGRINFKFPLFTKIFIPQFVPPHASFTVIFLLCRSPLDLRPTCKPWPCGASFVSMKTAGFFLKLCRYNLKKRGKSPDVPMKPPAQITKEAELKWDLSKIVNTQIYPRPRSEYQENLGQVKRNVAVESLHSAAPRTRGYLEVGFGYAMW